MQAHAGNLQEQAAERTGNQGCQRGTAEEDRNRLAALGARQPAGEIVDNPREEAGFGDAQQKTQDIEVGFVLDKGHQGGGDAPGEHDPGQPDAGPDFLQQHVGGHFEQCIANEKQPGAKAVGGGTNAQVMLHM